LGKRVNYGYEKRQKELKRKRKKAEKAERKRQKKEATDGTDQAGTAPAVDEFSTSIQDPPADSHLEDGNR
jgi:hypothetical protein